MEWWAYWALEFLDALATNDGSKRLWTNSVVEVVWITIVVVVVLVWCSSGLVMVVVKQNGGSGGIIVWWYW
jgi:hypothetical protein